MRRGRSTGKPTQAEAARIVAAKRGPCVACLSGAERGVIAWEYVCRGGTADDGHELPMMEYNHTKSGNIRRGHMAGYALCLWHHHGSQQLNALGMSAPAAVVLWGPNLFDHANAFHDAFGSDDDLIQLQTDIIERGNP